MQQMSLSRFASLGLAGEGVAGVAYHGLYPAEEDDDPAHAWKAGDPDYWHPKWMGVVCRSDQALLKALRTARKTFIEVRQLCRDGRTTWVANYWEKGTMEPQCDNQFVVIELADDAQSDSTMLVRFAEPIKRACEAFTGEGDPEKWKEEHEDEEEFWFTEQRIIVCRTDEELLGAVKRAKEAFLRIRELGRQGKGHWL